MATPLNPQTVQRLAFIRFLYEQGLAQSQQAQPMAATSVLSFHDGVELFLVLAGEHLQVNLPTNINFSEYWDRLAPKLPAGTTLPSKKAMERMNKLRVNLKHHGAVPSPTDITQVRADVTTFFTDATALIFGGVFTDIDMIDLVARPETVKLLQDAHTHAAAGDLPAAMAGLHIAFVELIDYYTEHRANTPQPPFRFGHTVNAYQDPNLDMRNKQGRQLERLTEATREIQQAMRVISLGIDYARYSQFQILVPTVHRYINGDARYTLDEAHKLVDTADYQFARLFVIESALEAGRADTALQRRLDRQQVVNPGTGAQMGWEERVWNGPR